MAAVAPGVARGATSASNVIWAIGAISSSVHDRAGCEAIAKPTAQSINVLASPRRAGLPI
jgi:hypothetical protein